jgi:hypothetical protein
MTDGTTNAVIVSVDGGKTGDWLPPTASDERIKAAAFPRKGVSESKAPFARIRSNQDSYSKETESTEKLSAERDGKAIRSVWPAAIPFPEDVEAYQSAKLVQHTGNRSGTGAHFTESRSVLPRKWSVPGGLEGINGWRSVLLRSKDNHSVSKRVRANPAEHLGEIVYAKVYERATFYDLLLNSDGKPFELREATKRDGKWERFVAWKDVSARPAGYVPFKSSSDCITCHSEAGSGGYGAARNPGWDTVLSEPLDGVETNGAVVDEFDYQPFGNGGSMIRRRR